MLNKNNFEIARLCPKAGGSKFALEGIRVTPAGTAVTDGHVLLKISNSSGSDHFDPFMLHAKVALKIAAALPVGSEIPIPRSSGRSNTLKAKRRPGSVSRTRMLTRTCTAPGRSMESFPTSTR